MQSQILLSSNHHQQQLRSEEQIKGTTIIPGSRGRKRYYDMQYHPESEQKPSHLPKQIRVSAEGYRKLRRHSDTHTRFQEVRHLLGAIWHGVEATGGPWHNLHLMALDDGEERRFARRDTAICTRQKEGVAAQLAAIEQDIIRLRQKPLRAKHKINEVRECFKLGLKRAKKSKKHSSESRTVVDNFYRELHRSRRERSMMDK
mmetsp:Transcript_22877/g.29687  ORF Transcript_22877/g.29687 Transcript_22877/m.29687 type:complete len:202 (+) Transcript_22877:144-749(+)|eukprot:CAMPEP_0117776060 /NCGR_PEP_ID=MMETSP0947-20121206/27525_1 /TAXON_ID=44440 /ORGANISM="Chattonella subsalsa, Strain CCMP2191" /LENGTH=201 /DNA_ID=CAMNT_0005602919 /DNA_START=90 /DNA_END=695 /DNA_ORIENTATION=+